MFTYVLFSVAHFLSHKKDSNWSFFIDLYNFLQKIPSEWKGNHIWPTLLVKVVKFKLKFSFSEKATKIWKKISHLLWRYLVKTAVLSKQAGGFFQFFGLLTNCYWNCCQKRLFWSLYTAPDQMSIVLKNYLSLAEKRMIFGYAAACCGPLTPYFGRYCNSKRNWKMSLLV